MEETKIKLSDKESINLLLEEYRSLREEVLRAISARFQILSLGLAGVALLAAHSVRALAGGDHEYAPVVLFLLVPVICIATFYTWYSEMRRARRASWYLWGIERGLNSKCGLGIFSWEQDLRKGMRIAHVFRKHYYANAVLFAAIPSICIYLGLMGCGKRSLICILGLVISVIVFISFMFYKCYELKKFDQPSSQWPPEVKTKFIMN